MRIKGCLAGLTALLMLLMAGCTPKEGGSKPEDVAMGRYVETELALPAETVQVLALRAAAGGEAELLAYIKNEEQPERWIDLALYRSADGGQSWEREDSDLDSRMEELGELQVEAAAWDEQGALYLYATNWGEEEPVEGFLKVDDSGQPVWLPIAPPADEGGSMLRGFRVDIGGDLLVDCWYTLFHLDGETGEVRYQFTPEDGSVEGYAVRDGQAVWSDGDELVFYDLATAAETGRVAVSAITPSNDNGNWARLAAFDQTGAVCYADGGGIYRAQAGNSMLEQVVDGSLCSLSVPSISLQSMSVTDDTFLVLGWTEDVGFRLLSYSYDPDVPTLPGTELRVWSMEDDLLLRQAIGAFQLAHPEVHITYDVYYTGEDAYSWDDALKTLATELVAGKGPDILSLDGLPLASYEEKGVLLDLSADLKELTDSGALLDNITSAYLREDGTCPAIPTQFSVPLLHGASDAIEASRDLKSMADWLEANRNSFNHPLYMEQIDWLLRFFSMPDVEAIYSGDRAVITEFLTQMKRLWDMEQNKAIEDDQYGHPEFNFGCLNWSVDACGIDMGELCKFSGLYPAWQTSQNKGDGETDTLFGGGIFVPRTVLGVNARSAGLDLAREFIRTILSEEVQGAAVGQGIPVNAAAFDASTQVDNDEARNGHFSTYGTTLTDGEGADMPIWLTVEYPTEEYRQAWAQRLKALDTPVTLSGSVQAILEEDTADFFAGKAGLEETVDKIVQKLELYRAEQIQ